MPEGGGTEWRQQLEKQIEELQKDTKILLRAPGSSKEHSSQTTTLHSLDSKI